MKELEAYEKAVNSLPEGCRAAEAEAEKTEIRSVCVSGGSASDLNVSSQTELFVRASEERTGMAYTQKLTEEPEEVIRRALTNSRFSRSDGAEPMNRPETGKEGNRNPEGGGSLAGNVPDYGTEELLNAAAGLERDMTADCEEVCYSSVRITQTKNGIGVVNSFGLNREASCGRVDLEAVLVERVKGASGGECSVEGFCSASDLPSLIGRAGRLFEKKKRESRLSLLPAGKAEPGEYRILLSGEASANILLTAWQLFSARAYQAGSSALAGQLGRRLFSERVTIEDRNVSGECGFSYELDCEGTECRNTLIVENGVFTGLMHNLQTAEAAGVASTGNAGRKTLLGGNIHTDTLVMPHVFTLLPGEMDTEELLCELSDGIYIDESLDVYHSVNIASGEFHIPCRGIVVERGKRVARIEGITINGTIRELLSDVEAAGKELAVRPLDMYRSYTVMAPALLVKKLSVAG